jgi:hypothetical protein
MASQNVSETVIGGVKFFTLTGIARQYGDCRDTWARRQRDHRDFPVADYTNPAGWSYWRLSTIETWLKGLLTKTGGRPLSRRLRRQAMGESTPA